jgi:outer membrane receptor for ferrienterochelin and colicins
VIPAKSEVLRVLDSKTREPLVSATVHVRCLEKACKDSIIVKRSDRAGKINHTFRGNVEIIVTYIGYETIKDTISGDNDILLTPKSIMFDEIVTTGQFVPQSSKKSIYPVEVIRADEIESKGSNNLREVLMTETNINLSQDNILGSGISINGVSGQNVKILIDGVPVIGRLNGNVDVSQINMNNVTQVEIIEGPMSTIYGTDALGGVINIITDDATCERFEFGANSYYESAGLGTYNFDGSARLNIDDFNFSLNGGRNMFRGYNPGDNGRFMQWKPKEQYFADWQAVKEFKNHRLRYTGRYFNEYILNRGEPREPYFENAFDDKYITDRFTNSLFMNGKLGNGRYYDLLFSRSNYIRHKNSYVTVMPSLDMTLRDADMQDTSRFNAWVFRGTYSKDDVTKKLSYQAGLEANIEDVEGKRIESGHKEAADYSFFGSVQYSPWSKLTIQPSFRAIYNTMYDAPIIPSFNVKYDFTDDISLRASWAKGFRAPTLKELYFDFFDINHNIQGNQELLAEKSDSYNLSVTFSKYFNKQYFKLQPKVFFNDIENMITLAMVEETEDGNDLYTNINRGEYKTIGFDVTAQYLRKNFSYSGTFAYIGRPNFYSEISGEDYNFSPEFGSNFEYTFSSIGLKTALYYKYRGESPIFYQGADGNVIEVLTEDYHMADLTLSKTFFEDYSINFGVKNLFDVTDILSYSSGGAHSGGGASSSPVAWGRSVFVSLKLLIR